MREENITREDRQDDPHKDLEADFRAARDTEFHAYGGYERFE